MKIGLILECGPDGPDMHVFTHLATRILAEESLEADLSCATLDNKSKLLQQCGSTASVLFEEGCERILIIWNLYPPWGVHKQKPCRHEDREAIFGALEAANVDRNRVALICIQEELEAWLLADGEVLTGFLRSLNSHAKKVSHHKNPERIGCNPKTALNRLMQERNVGKYVDYLHARKIALRITDLSRLRKVCPTFQRFEQKLRP